jgi:hypothetical protein
MQTTRFYISFLLLSVWAATAPGYAGPTRASGATSSTVTISWDAVTQDTTGAPETDPVYYNLYCNTYPAFTPSTSNFLVATTSTSYQHTDSRLADPLVHLFYVVTAVDIWGNQSAVSARVGEVDYVLARTKVFLQGCFQTNNDSMTTTLKDGDYIPLSSPYSEAPRTVTSIPSGAIDWILVQLRSVYNGAVVSQQSFFLMADGDIAEPDGSTLQIGLPNAASGNFYLVMRHRNHLAAMSSSAQALGKNGTSLYDFSTSSIKYYGSGGATLLNENVYGLWSGDINQDGQVTTTDYTFWYNSARAGEYGFKTADLNGDGQVTTSDYTIWYNVARAGASSTVP